MNEQKHWNKIADTYNQEIFDVFASDRRKLLPHLLETNSKKNGTAIDFGCGNGKAFKLLSPLFKEVVAADISENLLKEAAARGFKNIRVIHKDLAKPRTGLPKSDFVFSCNVIMLPAIEANHRMFKNVASALKRGGKAVIVIPSTESMMFSTWTLAEVYRKEGVQSDQIDPDEFSYLKGKRHDLATGIFQIDGVPTKHYTAPELEVTLRDAGLRITAIEKLEYEWDSEIANAPANLRSPYPWDWIVVCKKAGG